jgi:hypothetical protein
MANSILRPAQILPQQHRREPRADRERDRRGRAALHLLVQGRDVRHAREDADRGRRTDLADQSVWHVEADDEGDAARRRGGAPDKLRGAALLQRRGCRS